jgi:hypothetical protein
MLGCVERKSFLARDDNEMLLVIGKRLSSGMKDHPPPPV